MTAGRYEDLTVNPESLAVQVRGRSGRWRDADRLSHGTMEQIYLLLRMAMADHLTRPGEICPLLMDDVTVESDAGRKLSRYHWLMTTEEIVAAALKLDHKERARLAGRLLRSLDEEEEKLSPAEFEALWLEEAERRLEEWEQGKVEGIPGDKVMKELRDLLA